MEECERGEPWCEGDDERAVDGLDLLVQGGDQPMEIEMERGDGGLEKGCQECVGVPIGTFEGKVGEAKGKGRAVVWTGKCTHTDGERLEICKMI